MERFCLTSAGLSGGMAVGLGAFGAHGMKKMVAALPPDEASRILGWVDTGARYQLLHAAALLALAALLPRLAPAPARWAAHGFFWGSLVFSVSLYALALGAPLWLGAVTPLGGLGMLAGWGALCYAGAKRTS